MNNNPLLPRSILTALLQSTSTLFHGYRWENELEPCTGITAVNIQERRIFRDSGIYFSPYHRHLSRTRDAVAAGKIRRIDYSLPVDFGFGVERSVQLLLATGELRSEDPVAPLLLVDILEEPQAFAGKADPYDTLWLREDTWRFRTAVKAVLEDLAVPTRPFSWCADWETVPLLEYLQDRGHIGKLHLHNAFDQFMPEWGETALQRGLRIAHVAAAVSRGWVRGLRTEPIHTRVLAPHLGDAVARIRPVENGNFVDVGDELRKLATLLKRSPIRGAAQLHQLKQTARARLPAEIQGRLGSKTLAIAMGRCVSQKLHDVVVEAFESVLKFAPDFPVFVVFATAGGDPASDRRRAAIEDFCARHPSNAISVGKINWFDVLMEAADLNLMASLLEPFGGAFHKTVLPLARAVDGLTQVSPRTARGAAAAFHSAAPPTGWLVREPQLDSCVQDLAELLDGRVWAPAHNPTFRGMVQAFADGLREAVEVHQQHPLEFAQMVGNAIRFQLTRDWLDEEIRYGRMLTL